MTQPLLSIITGARNRPDDFRRLVDSIEDCTSVPWELVVSDASDKPIEQESVATDVTWPKITIIPERPRLGCTLGYNEAFRQAKGKWVIWLNDDCVVEPEYADHAIGFMEAHPEIGLGALAYAEPGQPKYRIHSYFNLPYANFGILRRGFGNELGWFDEDFPMYASDNALAFKVLLAGKGIAEVPGARIYHFATDDSHRAENNHPDERKRDAERLLAKYGSRMAEMRSIYERTRLNGEHSYDQTPRWMMEQANR